MDFDTYLARIPKVELHNHLIGTVRPATLAALATKHDLPLPRPPDRLYDFAAFDEFLDVLRLAASALRTEADFARVAYEAVEDGFEAGNLRHVEFLFNPQYFTPQGVAYRTMVDGMIAGLREAETDFGVSALLVPSFDRMIAPAAALDIMDDIEAYRPDAIVGIGLDGAERNGPPQAFAAVYARAKAAGLKRTAHVCEDNQTLAEAPPLHYDICRDTLACDRLDHGYNLLTDAATIARAQADGLTFNVCTVTSVKANREGRRARIARMVDLGLDVTLNTDDAAMFKTDLAQCYQLMFAGRDWGKRQARAFSLAGVEACWLPDDRKARLRQAFVAEIDKLDAELAAAMSVFSPFVRYFDEVARLGSIRKAAEHLDVAPSAVNKQILKLEEQLGERLFDRHARGLRLTRAGEVLIYNIRRWQTDYGAICTQIGARAAFGTGHVTLATVEGAASGLVGGIVKSFGRTHADVALTIEVAPSDEVVRRVRNGDVDLGLSFDPPPHPSLRTEAAAEFRVGAVVAPDHPLARRKALSFRECLGHPLIVPDRTLMLRTRIDMLATPVLADFAPQFTCNSIAMMKSLARLGIGIGLLTDLDVMTETDAGDLVYVELDDPLPAATLSLFVAANRHFETAASLFIAFFARQLTGEGSRVTAVHAR